jgi:hypothetical protein
MHNEHLRYAYAKQSADRKLHQFPGRESWRTYCGLKRERMYSPSNYEEHLRAASRCVICFPKTAK